MKTLLNRFEELKNLRKDLFELATQYSYSSDEFKLIMERVEMVDSELVAIHQELNIEPKHGARKCSAKLDFTKWEKVDFFDEVEDRYINVNIEITGTSVEEVNEAYDKLSAIMVEELDEYDFQFANCPDEEVNERTGKVYYRECAIVPYEHGSTSSIKKDIMNVWKNAKKRVGVR